MKQISQIIHNTLFKQGLLQQTANRSSDTIRTSNQECNSNEGKNKTC